MLLQRVIRAHFNRVGIFTMLGPIEDDVSELQRARLAATITLPSCVAGPFAVRKRAVVAPPSGANADPEAAEIPGLFPLTFNLPAVDLVAGDADDGGDAATGGDTTPLRVGVVLSGGQAPGGHNVIAGLFDHVVGRCGGTLFGFQDGPHGIYAGEYEELTAAKVARFRNMARRSSAEHLIATKALHCTATAWMLIVAQCSAIP